MIYSRTAAVAVTYQRFYSEECVDLIKLVTCVKPLIFITGNVYVKHLIEGYVPFKYDSQGLFSLHFWNLHFVIF